MSLTPLKELAILGTLRAHPLHGYALVEALENGLGWTVGLTRPTVYTVLRRFVERGWIEGQSVRDSRYPEREVYQVTEAGQRAYTQLLEKCCDNQTEGTQPLVTLLFHLEDVDVVRRRATLNALLAQRQTRLDALNAIAEHEGMIETALQLLRDQLALEVQTIKRLLNG
jgi:DNA-binding PadR family transcriptional regulator